MKYIVMAMITFSAAPAMAQDHAAHTGSPAIASARDLWNGITANLIRAAEQMPETEYGYKPAPTVRSFGQMIGHVAGAQNLICAAALGEPQKSEDAVEKSVTSKAGLVAAMKSSTEYCRRAYGQTESASMGMTKLFGQDRPRIHALLLNATHNAEHYGNLVTYLRIKGMVPPSSQPRSAGQ